MGSKSQVRSMQRGAHKRDRGPISKESDYAGKPPAIRDEDRAHLGLTDEAFDRLARSLREKVHGYARAGFRKPADVARLLNREKIRTAASCEWNPRLVHFLLGHIYGDRPSERKTAVIKQPLPDQNTFDAVRLKISGSDKAGKSRPRAVTKKSAATANATSALKAAVATDTANRGGETGSSGSTATKSTPLSADEMKLKLAALQAHFSKAQ